MYKQDFSVSMDGGQFFLPLTDALLDGRYRWSSKRHCHADYELHLILDGSCIVHIETGQYTLQPGNALLIAPGQYHQPLETSENFHRLCICFSLSQGELSRALAQVVPSCEVLTMEFQEAAQGILRELASPSPFGSTLLHGYLEQLLVMLLRKLKIAPRSTPSPMASDLRTAVIDEYFESHITDCSEAELAKSLHLSTRQLSRVLQRDYGMSFRQKRTGARMDYAGFLLRTTKQSIGEVCTTVGYQSEAVFYRNFKAHFGLSPQQYRKKNEIP